MKLLLGSVSSSKIDGRFLSATLLLLTVLSLFLPREAGAAAVSTVQNGSVTSSANGTTTVTISSIDPTKSFLMFETRHNSNRPVGSMIRGRIASATTLEFTRVTNETSTMTIEWYVVSFSSGVTVQRGEVAQGATTTNVTLGTPVSSLNRAFVTFSKTATSTDATYNDNDGVVAELTTTSNLQFRVNTATSTHTISWQVIEFPSAADIFVQKGTTSLASGAATATITLGTTVDLTKAFVLVGSRNAIGTADIGAQLLRARLTGTTTLVIDRNNTSGAITEIGWQVVELRDGSVVQAGNRNLASGTSTGAITISSVDLARTIAFSGVQMGGGQNTGRSPYAADDILGVGSVTLDLTSATNINMQRNNTAAATDVGWFAVQFNGASADLAVTKTVDDATPDVGQAIVYKVLLQNLGPSATTGVTLTDLLPSGVTYQSHVASQGTYVNGTGVWTVGSMANAEVDSLQITATVNAGTGGQTIVNTGSITASGVADPVSGNNSSNVSVTVQSADISVVKTVDNATPTVGSSIVYKVRLSNLGPHTSTGLVITDLLPSGVTYVSHVVSQGTYVQGTGVWTLGTMVNAEVDSLQITATVNAGTGGQTIVNTATKTAGPVSDPVSGNNASSVSVVVQSADISVIKTVDNAIPNESQSIVYKVRVSNLGPHTSTGLVITDLLPSGVTYVSHVVSQGTYVQGTGVWTLGTMVNAEVDSLQITATVNAGTGGQTIVNTATKTAGPVSDPVSGNNASSVSVVVQSADISVVKLVDDATPDVGQAILYTVRVTNLGPHTSTGLVITDLLPAGVTYQSHLVSQGTYVNGTGLWTLGTMANAEVDSLRITATVNAGTGGQTIVNTATKTAGAVSDPVPANDTASVPVTVNVSADIAVTKTVDDATPDAGQAIVYKVRVQNLGPDASTGLEITDLLPAGVTYQSHVASQGTYVSGTGVWTLGTMVNAEVDSLQITATVNAGTGGQTIVNTATRTAGAASDPVPGNDSSSVPVTVNLSADVAVTKTVDDLIPIVGQAVVYKVRAANNGPNTATGLVITDLLPAGVTYQSHVVSQGTYVNGTGVWTLGTQANGEADSLEITATVNAGMGGQMIVNTATKTAGDVPDPVSGNDSGSASITVVSEDPAVVNFVQSGSLTSSGNGTVTVPITAIDPSRSFLVFESRHDSNRPVGSVIRGRIASATTLEFTRVTDETSTMTIEWYVVEFISGVLVQRGETSQSTTAVNVTLADPVSSVNRAFVLVSKTADATNVTWSSDDPFVAELTTPSNLQIRVDSASPGHTVSWQVIEYTNPLDILVQKGTTNMLTGVGSVNATLSTAVDLTKTFVLVGYRTALGTADIGNRMLQARLTSPTTVTIDRSITTGDITEIVWQAVELRDGSTVQSGSQSLANGVASQNIAISPVDLTRSIAFASVQPGGGQNMGRSPYSLDDILGVGSVTLDLTSSTNVVMERSNTAEATDVGWFVVQFKGVAGEADVALMKSVDDASPDVGQAIVYKVRAENLGPDTSTGLVITDLLPAGVTYQSHLVSQGTYVNGTGLWTLGTLASGEADSLEITATVDLGTGGQTIVNTATKTAGDVADPVSANDTASASITVNSADVAVTKTVDNPAPNEGQAVIYKVVATNNGPNPSTGLVITDLLPAGVTYQSHVVSQGTYVNGTGVWTLGTLGNGEADSLEITATVDLGTGGQTIVNTATKTAGDVADPVAGNNTANASITVNSADVAVAKTVDDGSPDVSQAIVYKVVATNNGPNPSTGLVITDLLPAGVTYQSHVVSQGTYVNGTGVWTLGTLGNGEADSLEITATVDLGTGGQTIVNTATKTAGDVADPVAGNNTANASITVNSADVAVTKTVDDASPDVAQAIVYKVVATNNGPDPSTGLVITDLLPAGVTYQSHVASQGTYVNGTGLWTLGTLGNGEADSLEITATVDLGTGGQTIVNTATKTAGDVADAVPANDTANASITVNSADVAVTKTVDDASPDEGQAIVYKVVATNNGPNASTGLVITDLLPSGVTYQSHVVSQGTYVIGTGLWTLGTLANGEADSLEITATVDLGTGGQTIVNTATKTAGDVADPVAGNNTANASITVNSADVAVTKTVDDASPDVAQAIVYKVVATNNGPNASTGLVITDLLPSGVTYQSHVVSQGTYVIGTGLWTLGTLANGEADSLEITATVDLGTGGQTIVNTATKTAGDVADPVAGNNTANASITVNSADVAVTKTVDDASPDVAQAIVYKVVATNNGPNASTGLVITDLLPSGVTYQSHVVSQGTYVNGTGLWTLGTLANGEADSLEITATVDVGTGGQTIVNTATKTAGDVADAVPANDTASASITVNSADVAVTKTVDDASPDVAQAIVYKVVATNNGPNASTGLVITDLLPSGVTYQSHVVSQGTYVNGTGVWTLGTLGNGEADSLEITATVDLGTGGQTIVNTATKTAGDVADPVPANDTASASITVNSADVAVTKTVDDASPDVAQAIVYKVVATNNGPNASTGLVITDLLPSGVTYQSHVVSQGTYVNGTGLWTLGTLANGEADSLEITATVDVGTGGQTIVNTATKTAGDVADAVPANDTANASITVNSADVAVTKTVDDTSPDVAQAIVYKVVATNNGPNASTGLVITDLLPSGVTYQSHVVSQGTYVNGTGLWTLGTLANGEADSLEITATVDVGTGGQTIVNTATKTAGDVADPVAGNNTANASVTVNQSADVAVAKTVDNAAPNEGQAVVFKVVATNNGPDPSTGLVITDLLPAGVTYQSHVVSQGTYVNGTGLWTLGTLGNGEADSLEITATVDVGTGGQTIVNTATKTAGDVADPVSANDTASASITVQSADVAVAKTVDDASPDESQAIVYKVVAANNGPNASTGLVITDLLPSGVTYQSHVVSQGTYVNGTGLWTLGTLANGEADSLEITATVDVGTAGQTIVNTATKTAGDVADPVAANDTSSAPVTVNQMADIVVTKTVDNAAPNEGQAVVYKVVATNNGPDPSTGLVITDLLPAGVTYQSHVASQGTYVNGTGLWTLGTLGNEEADSLEITATVDLGTGGQTIVNTATKTAGDVADPVAGNNTANASITVNSADVAVTKTVDDASPDEGQAIVYKVVATNNGPNASTGLVITDLLPAGVTYQSHVASQGTYVNGTGLWTLGTLGNGEADSLEITATVDLGTGGQTIVNTATKTAGDVADPVSANDTASTSITVRSADLSVVKTVDETTHSEGDTLTYVVEVTNLGPEGTGGVEVTDLLPSGVTYVSHTTTQGTYTVGTGLWDVGFLGTEPDSARVMPIGDSITSGSNGHASYRAWLWLALADSAYAVDFVGTENGVHNGSPPFGGWDMDHEGHSGFRADQVRDSVGVWARAKQPDVVLLHVGHNDLAQGQDVSSTVADVEAIIDSLRAVNPHVAVMLAQVVPSSVGGGFTSIPAYNVALAALAGTKDEPESRVVVVDQETGFNPVTDTYDGVHPNDQGEQKVSGKWMGGMGPFVANWGRAELQVRATVDLGTAGGSIVNVAGVTASDLSDPQSGNNADTVTVDVGRVDLFVTKDVSEGMPSEGDTVSYTVVVGNDGPSVATGVEVTDALPSGVAYASHTTTQGTYVPGTGLWSVGSLGVGDRDTLGIEVVVMVGTMGEHIVNVAGVTGRDQEDPQSGNDADSVAVDVNVVPDPPLGDVVFESAHVHPMEMTPDRLRLLAVNTDDHRLSVFALNPIGVDFVMPELEMEVMVGVEPVTVRARTNGEAWVVNHISDSISIVDLTTGSVVKTLLVGNEPTDVVFAGGWAFVCVSEEDVVRVYDAVDPDSVVAEVPMGGPNPRSMEVGKNGDKVYVGVMDSGNRTTIVPDSVVASTLGLPPPVPPMSGGLPAAPSVGLIVRHDGTGWKDELGRTWDFALPYVLGDVDVVEIDVAGKVVTNEYGGVGTTLFDVSVNPVNGNLVVTNQEALNEVRFEPNVRGQFARTRVSRVNVGTGAVTVEPLNDHINYGNASGNAVERSQSVSLPMEAVMLSNGLDLYVTGFGSKKIAMMLMDGTIARRVTVGNGPTGLAIDTDRDRIYVLNRMDNTISAVALSSATTTSLGEVKLGLDCTPLNVREGRRVFYDAELGSSHGDVSCATCHVFAGLDGLAWDLGDPTGTMMPIPPGHPATGQFHPMKGPMITQALKEMSGTEPLHWRGDRPDLVTFNLGFTGLLGRSSFIDPGDFQMMEDFLFAVKYPPNPFRLLDGTLPNPGSSPNPTNGQALFMSGALVGNGDCVDCHALPTGTNGVIEPMNAVRERVALKTPQLRNLYERTGFAKTGTPSRGFGFMHDGVEPSVFTFLQSGAFDFTTDDDRRDVEAFVMAFPSGVHAAVGAQWTMDGTNEAAGLGRVTTLMSVADGDQVGLIAKGRDLGGAARGWTYLGGGVWISDRVSEGTTTLTAMLALVGSGREMTFTAVVEGWEYRLGVERDKDGYRDRDEEDAGSLPNDPNSTPENVGVEESGVAGRLVLEAAMPNPAGAGGTRVTYGVMERGKVSLSVYDVQGRRVRTLVEGEQGEGRYEARWDLTDDTTRRVAGGVYFFRLTTPGGSRTQRLIVLQ